MNKEIIKKVKAVVLLFIVIGVFFFGFNTGQSWGIYNDASGDNAIILGNQLEGNTLGGLNNSGAGCPVANNLP